MTESAVRQASYRLRQRYRQVLREEIAHTVMLPGDIDDELRHLIAVLRGVTNDGHEFRCTIANCGALMARSASNEDCHHRLRKCGAKIPVTQQEVCPACLLRRSWSARRTNL